MSDISAFGISATLPPGWDGQIFRRPSVPDVARGGDPSAVEPQVLADGTVRPVAHLANFALPNQRGDYGSGAVERMGPADVLVCLLEFDAEAAGTPLFSSIGVPRFRLDDFAPHTMQRTIAGMCGAQAFFSEGGRAFCAYVVLGSFRLRAPLVPPVNRLMASVRIDPA
jgi:hypothetical protein